MANSAKTYIQLIAVNLVPLMEELRQNPPAIPGFRISRMEYLISLILTHKQDDHPDAWSVLHMPYLLKVVPKANEYLKLLREKGAIEWKNYYAGRNSRLYRLNGEGKTEFRAISDKNLIRRIEQAQVNMSMRNSRKYPHLNCYIQRVRLNIVEAMRTVEIVYQVGSRIDVATAESRRTFSVAEIGKIQSGQIYIKCNSTNGRLDSNFTRLPSELVQHLHIDGKPLSEIDLRNSQPFFAAAMICPTREINYVLEKYLGRKLMTKTRALSIRDREDVQQYISLVTSGTLYEPFLIDRVKEAGIIGVDRKELKGRVFRVFFGKIGSWRYDRVAWIFRKAFPNVVTYFELIKVGDHSRLAVILQRLESYTMLNRVAPTIIKELPDLPFITKHDSILPVHIESSDSIGQVARIMKGVITEVTGLTPSVSIKDQIINSQSRA
jgi:hypothetical protein